MTRSSRERTGAMFGLGSEDPSLIAAIERASAGPGPETAPRRSAVLHEVFISSNPDWLRPFAVMLVLSGFIAALGLTQNSAAVIIGAMVIAPLGSPMVALGGALALGWFGPALRMLLTILVGSLIVIACGFVVGMLLPPMTPTSELLARTDPDLRDLGVAALAGAAGAYARTRTELYSVLAGVAISVALAPPLAAAGLLFEAGHPLLARGAILLLSTNLVGIAVAASVVMVLTGYAPRPSLPRTRTGMAFTALAVVSIIAVVIPLSAAYAGLSQESVRLANINRTVTSAIGLGIAPLVAGVQVEGNTVTVEISPGSQGTVNVTQVQQRIQDALGPNFSVSVSLL